MKRSLDVTQKFENFEGKEFEENGSPVLLKTIVLSYLRQSDRMGLTDAEQSTAYEAGLAISHGENPVVLTSAQYNVIKKLADNGKMKDGSGAESNMFPMEVRFGAREMIDSAPMVEEEK